MLFFRYGGDGTEPDSFRRSVRTLIIIGVFSALCIGSSVCLTQQESISLSSPLTIVAMVMGAGALASIITLSCMPSRDVSNLRFRCPLVPWIPALGVLVNLYMCASRTSLTYYSFLIWFAIGMLIYFFYGVSHSTLRIKNGTEKERLINSDKFHDEIDE